MNECFATRYLSRAETQHSSFIPKFIPSLILQTHVGCLLCTRQCARSQEGRGVHLSQSLEPEMGRSRHREAGAEMEGSKTRAQSRTPDLTEGLHSCSRLPLTRRHRPGGLNNRNSFSPSPGGWKSTIKVPVGLVASEASPRGLQVDGAFLLCPRMVMCACVCACVHVSVRSLSLSLCPNLLFR